MNHHSSLLVLARNATAEKIGAAERFITLGRGLVGRSAALAVLLPVLHKSHGFSLRVLQRNAVLIIGRC